MTSIFAAELSVEDYNGVASEGDLVITADPNASAADIFVLEMGDLVVAPERVLNYDQTYHLAYVTVNDAAVIDWYIFNVNGTIYNGGTARVSTAGTIEIRWNSLDLNGHHPAGQWNKPATKTFYLTVVATDSYGYGVTKTAAFQYTWYDNERPASIYGKIQTMAPGIGRIRIDVPHTGL